MMSNVRNSIRLATTTVIAALFSATCVVAGNGGVRPVDEFPEEAAALLAATSTLFDTIEADLSAEDSAPAFQGFRIKELATPANFTDDSALSRAFPTNRGPVQNLTGYRISWYPVDRFLGAVDFMGTYDGNRNLVCGFVTWDLSDPEDPKLEHLVANYVDISLLSKLPAPDAHLALLESNCAYGEIDPNFTVFGPAS